MKKKIKAMAGYGMKKKGTGGLKGGQKKLDKNKDGKISGADFKMMKKGGVKKSYGGLTKMGGDMMQKGMGGMKQYKAAGAKDFKPHMMYDPKTGKGYKANKYEDHVRMDKKGYTHKKGMIKAEAGNMKSNFLEPVTPRMFEDGGLKRKDRQEKRVSNRLAKKTASGKKLGKKESALKSKRDLAAAKIAADAARKNIKKVTPKKKVSLPVDRRSGTLAGGTSGGSVLKKAAAKVNAQQKNMSARVKGELSRAKDDLARKNKTGQYETFGSAFAKARAKAKKAGNADGGIFTYKGKKYNTKTKKATPKPAPKKSNFLSE